MSKLRFCGTCGLDLQAIPRKFARKYRRDPAHCPRCGALTDAEAFTLRRQSTAERLAVGPLIAPLEPTPPPKTAPRHHAGAFINTLAASLIAVVIVLATLALLGVITLPRSLPTTTHAVVASPTSAPTMTLMRTTLPTNVGTGAPTIMTITPYALVTDCSDAMTTTSLINAGSAAFHWSATITSQGGATVPFQLAPMSGLLQAQATQTLTLSHIVQAGTIVISANGIAESIIVTCAALTVTPISTTPPQ